MKIANDPATRSVWHPVSASTLKVGDEVTITTTWEYRDPKGRDVDYARGVVISVDDRLDGLVTLSDKKEEFLVYVRPQAGMESVDISRFGPVMDSGR